MAPIPSVPQLSLLSRRGWANSLKGTAWQEHNQALQFWFLVARLKIPGGSHQDPFIFFKPVLTKPFTTMSTKSNSGGIYVHIKRRGRYKTQGSRFKWTVGRAGIMSVTRGFTLRRTVQRWHIHSPGGSISSLSGGLLQEKYKATLYCYFWNASSHIHAALVRVAVQVPLPGTSSFSLWWCSPVLLPHTSTWQDTSKMLVFHDTHLISTMQHAPWFQRTVLELNSKDKWKIHLCATHIPPSAPTPP